MLSNRLTAFVLKLFSLCLNLGAVNRVWDGDIKHSCNTTCARLQALEHRKG